MKNSAIINTKYIEDKIRLQNVVPEEIWRQILYNITDVADYQTICVASPYLQELILQFRTNILFPKVAYHFVHFILLTNEASPLLLNCRLVSKVWKNGVDEALQHILHQSIPDSTGLMFPFYPVSVITRNRANLYQRLETENKIDCFLEKFENSHFHTGRNPFPFRALYIFNRFEGNYSSYYSKLLNFLEKYGHHVRHCVLRLTYERNELVQTILIFRSILELMPELCTLKIQYLSCMFDITENLQNILLAHPLPKLEKLQILEERDLAEPLFTNLLENNDHVTTLILHGMESERNSALFTTPLPNLEELHIIYFIHPEDFINLRNAQVTWPLKKLTIICHPDIPAVDSMFNFIEARFAETLTHLDIRIPSTATPLKTHILSLPHLKSLKVALREYTSMDFILPTVTSLMSLNVRIEGSARYEDTLEDDSTIKFFLYRENLLMSNIWELFHKLWNITYVDENVQNSLCFSRYHWERFKDQ